MKTSKIGLALCCVVYLGACGSDTPSGGSGGGPTYDSLLAKENQARSCAGLSPLTPTTDQKSKFLAVCNNSADFAILDQGATCAVDKYCNKSASSCPNQLSKLSSACATYLAQIPGGDAAFFSGGI
jgi:hypothetical protein